MKTCVECKGNVQGEFQGVPLSICCAQCCATKTDQPYSDISYRYTRCISRAAARRICKDCLKDLDTLCYSKQQRNRYVRYWYVRKEVELLASLDKAKKLEEKRKREEEKLKELKLEAKKRKVELEELLQLNLGDMDPVLRCFMLEDYLEPQPRVRFATVFQRCHVYDRVRQICAECACAHPRAAFDFCVENPTGGPKEFQELKERMQRVFRLEGARILYNVPKSQREMLTHTPLVDVLREFEDRDRKAFIRSHLEQLVGMETANAIMDHPACQRRLRIPAFEGTVAKQLVQFWNEKDDRDMRRNRVKAALREVCCEWRDDCELCNQYIQGETDCDAEEVAAMVAIHEELDCCSLCPFGDRAKACHAKFCRNYYNELMDFQTSLDIALDTCMDLDVSDKPCGVSECICCSGVAAFFAGFDDFIAFNDVFGVFVPF